MKKTLYIQIDNNSVPEGCGEDVEVLDCRCINDFCSMVGDALVSDLKDENGKPYYRLINPVGRLLMDFKDVDKTTYDAIINNWYDIYGELLHKGKQEGAISLCFPDKYIDWLIQNDNKYYIEIGKRLSLENGIVALNRSDLNEGIVSSIIFRIMNVLQRNDFDFIVFDTEIIATSSDIVKEIKAEFPHLHFLRFSQWQELKEEKKASATKLDRCRDFHVDGVFLGEQVPSITIDWYVSEKDNVCNKLEFQRLDKNGKMLNSLLSCIMGEYVDYRQISYNDIYNHLIPLKFRVTKEPYIEYDSSWRCSRLRAVLRKETKDFVCVIVFYGSDKGNSTNIDIAKDEKGTLKSICVDYFLLLRLP